MNAVTTIIISIVLGIAANLLTPIISRVLGKFSGSIRDTNTKKKQVFEKTVFYILENPNEEVYLRIRETEYMLVTVIILMSGIIIAAIFLSVDSLLQLMASLPLIFLGFYFFTRSFKFIRINSEVMRRRKMQNPDIDID